MTPQEMYEAIKERNMPIDPAEEKYHFLLHQRVSKLIAKENLGIHDEVILSAIECHTTLKKDAGVCDKIIFLADKISWDQEGIPPYYEMLKELAAESLDKACFYYINYQFENHLLLMPHRWIEEAYEDLKVKLKMDDDGGVIKKRGKTAFKIKKHGNTMHTIFGSEQPEHLWKGLPETKKTRSGC